MGVYVVPEVTREQVAAGWSGIEAEAESRRLRREATLRAELTAAGIVPSAVEEILVEDRREARYVALAAAIVCPPKRVLGRAS